MMEEYVETTPVVEPERQGEEQIPTQKGKKQRRTKQSRAERAEDFEDDKSLISDESYSLWEKNLSDKGFIGERGFGKLISLFAEIIEKRGWSMFFTHKQPAFAAVVKEVLCQYDGDEGKLCICLRNMGPYGP